MQLSAGTALLNDPALCATTALGPRLTALTTLNLCNRNIEIISGLDSLVRLRVLDLSFNKITTVEGLESHTALRELSLFGNELTQLQGLHHCAALVHLSLGHNLLRSLRGVVGYLHTSFRHLRDLTLLGNPLAADPAYRQVCLAHLSGLVFLDHCRVAQADVQAAREHLADDVASVAEQDAAAAAEQEVQAKAAERAELIREAHAEGIAGLPEALTHHDAEWARLCCLPGVLDAWQPFVEKYNSLAEEVLATLLRHSETRKQLLARWHELGPKLAPAKDDQGTTKAHGLAGLGSTGAGAPSPLDGGHPGPSPPAAESAALRAHMADTEEAARALAALKQQLGHVAEESVRAGEEFFKETRELLARAWANMAVDRWRVVEDSSSSEGLGPEARALLADREALGSTLAACKDSQFAMFDTVEDRVITGAMQASSLAAKAQAVSDRQHDRLNQLMWRAA